MRPQRDAIHFDEASYFITTTTAERQPFFRHERWAELMMETLAHYDGNRYTLHAYVVMPDHLHLIVTPFESLEKSVQMVKGGFSFNAKRAFEWKFEIWMPGFTDHRIRDKEDWMHHINYIRQNPAEARLMPSPYPYMDFLRPDFPQGLKP